MNFMIVRIYGLLLSPNCYNEYFILYISYNFVCDVDEAATMIIIL